MCRVIQAKPVMGIPAERLGRVLVTYGSLTAKSDSVFAPPPLGVRETKGKNHCAGVIARTPG